MSFTAHAKPVPHGLRVSLSFPHDPASGASSVTPSFVLHKGAAHIVSYLHSQWGERWVASILHRAVTGDLERCASLWKGEASKPLVVDIGVSAHSQPRAVCPTNAAEACCCRCCASAVRVLSLPPPLTRPPHPHFSLSSLYKCRLCVRLAVPAGHIGECGLLWNACCVAGRTGRHVRRPALVLDLH